MPVLERILAFGVTGSGKSYQWLKIAEVLKPTGAIFRVLDTDNAIPFMLETQFPQLKPENGGNVYVHQSFTWPEYKTGVNWLQRRPPSKEEVEYLSVMEPNVLKDWQKNPVKPIDWTVVDMADNAWRTVQSYFVQEIFGEDPGDYFLQIRREMQVGIRKTKRGEMPASPVMEGLDGWKDWAVINKLYDDWMLPIVYRIPTHVYTTAKVEHLDTRTEKDEEVLMLYGDLKIRPSGQKALGHQMHSLFLMVPGKSEWFITTIKDRGGRSYFNKTKLISFYNQYLVAKANWPIVE
jgi:hypothetical protein